MNKLFRHVIILCQILFVGFTSASTSIELKDIPQLQQGPQHATVAKRVSDLFSRSHYKYMALDNVLSQKVFDRYLEQLDFNRQIKLTENIDPNERAAAQQAVKKIKDEAVKVKEAISKKQ